MTKYTDLQDSFEAARLHYSERSDKARRFCAEFSKAFTGFLNAGQDDVFFVKKKGTYNPDSNRIRRDDDPIFGGSGLEIWSNLLVHLGDSRRPKRVYVPFEFTLDRNAKTLHVTVSRIQPKKFDIEEGLDPISDFVFMSIKTFFDNDQDFSDDIIL